MSMKTLVNLPVKDLSRSTRFFTTLGFSFNQQFTDENTTCMIIGDDTYVMPHAEATFSSDPALRW